MDQVEILEKLTGLFREVFDDPSLRLTMQTTADDIPDWDSANNITMVVGSEQLFGVKFRAAEIEELKNIGDFVTLIGAKLAKAG